MRLALFDLDHTLIPFDSGMAWTDWAASVGVLPADAPQRYLDCARQLVAGRAGIRELHAAAVLPMAGLDAAQLHGGLQRFEQAMRPRLPADRLALVARHRDAGDCCVLVTATTRVLADVFGRLFGMQAVLATESTWLDGRPTGGIDGPPCWQVHKPEHVQRWLQVRGLDWPQLARSWFYSDSASDLPLLLKVSDPVVVRPDARLRAEAQARGWPLID